MKKALPCEGSAGTSNQSRDVAGRIIPDDDSRPHAPARKTRYSQDQLTHETELVWLRQAEEIQQLPYVREEFVACRGPQGKPLTSRCLLGYTRVDPRRTYFGGLYWRRVFWLAPHDPRHHGHRTGVYRRGAPMEAVDPRTVAPGVPGRLTSRAWGVAR